MLIMAAHLKPGDICYLEGDEFGDDQADRALVHSVNENAMALGWAAVEFDFGQVCFPPSQEIEVIEPAPGYPRAG